MRTHIYNPLAKCSVKIHELHTRVLRIQLGRVLEMAESAAAKCAYEKRIVERLGGQREFDFMDFHRLK